MASGKKSERLDKLIAAQTSYSRRDVHKLLSKGQILVNGQVSRNFDAKIDPESDEIRLDGKLLVLSKYSYIMLNKPAGVICATEDNVHKTVIDLLPQEFLRSGLFPAGRLDKDTEGFVLITNDGDLAHKILAPKSHVPKRYFVRLDKPVEAQVVDRFAQGMVLSGQRCMPAELVIFSQKPEEAVVVLRQGMYHQVKRMFLSCGYEVVYLRRDQIGGLKLDQTLQPGQSRLLTASEVTLLTDETPKK